MSDRLRHPESLSAGRRSVAFVGVVGVVALIVLGLSNPEAALRGYLAGWFLCLGTAIGPVAWNMIHHLTGGRWGWAIRRPAEAAGATLPFIALAFLPIAIGARWLFPWADPGAVASDELLRHRHALFAPAVTIGRAVVFLGLWSALCLLLGRWSRLHDRSGDAAVPARLARLSAAGLVAYFVTMSLAGVDWIASREVDWYSSTFGVVVVLGQAVAGICVLILALAAAHPRDDDAGLLSDRAVHDLGNLLLVAVVLWAYVSFMQFLVIWSGNSQEDLRWFYHRNRGAWRWVTIALVLGHFAVPFLLLLRQDVKRDLRRLAIVAAGVLVMRAVDVVWMIVPSGAGTLHVADVVAIVALPACWAWLYLGKLGAIAWVPRAREAELGPVVVATSDDGKGGHAPA